MKDGEEEVKYDPLLPFLGPQGKAATKEQALHAKKECLKEMKRRLLKRLEIINVILFFNQVPGHDCSLKKKKSLHKKIKILLCPWK